MICTFFGHRDAPTDIGEELKREILKVLNSHVDVDFIVGNQGNFDEMAASTLKELKEKYNFNYYVIPAYPPKKKIIPHPYYYPADVLKNVPKNCAIYNRNSWMVKKADYVIVYVTRNTGGAAKFAWMADMQDCYVINIATGKYFFDETYPEADEE